ncbi:hypothetical protein AAFF_G00181470 [Aldrovandia affinis]|uniref:Uncharacterized protein n=1 Tax=Aldrovandia affinis TaxID=143900 RepID=A0AAD7SZQ0_9TELE|nr:hypothetical protein AAFF_G00181470 [Aldrovandia affinis]
MWTLETVVKHQSYNSNEGIGKLFARMFPDSDIAKTFACGGDKTAYITKFGLAEYKEGSRRESQQRTIRCYV